jgi:hypothetical protein
VCRQNWLFGFCKRVGFVCRAKDNVPMWADNKIVLKKVRWEKFKKTRVGLGVGKFIF